MTKNKLIIPSKTISGCPITSEGIQLSGLEHMQRITITLDDELVEQFETFLQQKGYKNRSEAMRDLIRERLTRVEPDQHETRDCFATLSYVYDHHERDLSARMAEISHQHHDLNCSSSDLI